MFLAVQKNELARENLSVILLRYSLVMCVSARKIFVDGGHFKSQSVTSTSQIEPISEHLESSYYPQDGGKSRNIKWRVLDHINVYVI